MKGFTKVILTLAGVCFLFGAAITVAAASLGGRIPTEVGIQGDWYDRILFPIVHPSYHRETEFSDREFLEMVDEEASGEINQGSFKNIKISVEAAKLVITEGEDDSSISVKDGVDFIKWEQRVEEDTLELEFYRDMDAAKHFLGTVPSVVLVIPKGYEFDNIELSVGAGSIDAERMTARELELEAGAGAISINSGHTQKLSIDCQAGSVVYSGGVRSYLETDCQAGSVAISLEGKPEDFNYELEVNMGSIHIDQQKYSGLNKERSLVHEGAVKMAELECGAGSINLEFLE